MYNTFSVNNIEKLGSVRVVLSFDPETKFQFIPTKRAETITLYDVVKNPHYAQVEKTLRKYGIL